MENINNRILDYWDFNVELKFYKRSASLSDHLFERTIIKPATFNKQSER